MQVFIDPFTIWLTLQDLARAEIFNDGTMAGSAVISVLFRRLRPEHRSISVLSPKYSTEGSFLNLLRVVEQFGCEHLQLEPFHAIGIEPQRTHFPLVLVGGLGFRSSLAVLDAVELPVAVFGGPETGSELAIVGRHGDLVQLGAFCPQDWRVYVRAVLPYGVDFQTLTLRGLGVMGSFLLHVLRERAPLQKRLYLARRLMLLLRSRQRSLVTQQGNR